MIYLPTFQPNVGKYIIHGSYWYGVCQHSHRFFLVKNVEGFEKRDGPTWMDRCFFHQNLDLLNTVDG